jgi:tetratricopeptide (TPR) repeat protein
MSLLESLRKKSMQSSRNVYICLVLAVGTAFCYWQVRGFDFITFDDTGYVSENPHVSTGLNLNNIAWAFTTGHCANWHPLTWLSLMLDCQLSGADAGRIHFVNLLFHIGNTLLLFAVLKKMTDSAWPSAFVAALFAIHPMHVESVAWISERKDVLSTLFWLLTMAAYIAYAERGGAFRYLLTLGLFAFGLMAKPMLVTLPFVLLLLDYWPLNRFELKSAKLAQDGKRSRQNRKSARPKRSVFTRLIIEKIPFLALVAVSSVITFFVQRSSGAVVDVNYISVQKRFANAFVSYFEYISKMFWPANLAIFYPFPKAGLPFWEVTLCVLVLVVISLLVIRFGRRRKYLLVGWFWFIGTLVPVIGVVQVGVQAYADRYTYIPYIGLFIMIAWGISELVSKWAYGKLVLGAFMIVVLVLLGIRSFGQISYWRNSKTVFSHALEITQDNYVVHSCLGEYYLKQGELTSAIQECREAIKINPAWTYAHINLGSALAKEGKYAEAFNQFKQAVELNPDIAGAHYDLGKTLGIQGRFDGALEQFREAVRLEPHWPDPMNDFAFVVAAHPEVKNRDINEAIRLARRACELTEYKNITYLKTLAAVYASAGRFSEAADIFEISLKLDPNSASLRNGLGNALLSEGKFKEAISQIRRSLEIEPNNPDTKNSLAWILATCPDANMRNPGEAIRLAQEACAATNYAEASKLDTLAAAYASAGRFDEAIETAEKALSAADKGQTGLARMIQDHLNLYRASKPYIDTVPRDENAR